MSYCLNPDCSQPQNQSSAITCQTCGTRLLLKDRYRAIRKIGQGGFGRTFLAIDEDKPSKPHCAIKQLWSRHWDTQNFQKAAEMFQKEAIRLDELGKHPQIPELFAHFAQDDRLYLVQEYIEGQNLYQELLDNGAFDETGITQLLTSLLPVLRFIHEHQVIHRDIKPANIIRRNCDQQVVLVDFGASKYATSADLAQTGTRIGSPEYVAPEQLQGKATFASDIYSLGVTCIHLLTGRSPFELFDTYTHTWSWQKYLYRPLSPLLKSILGKMLQIPIQSRYQSAQDVLAAMTVLSGSNPVLLQQPVAQLGQVTPPPAPSQGSTAPVADFNLKPVRVGDKWGYADPSGQIVTVDLFEAACEFREGLAAVQAVNSLWGFIDQSGQVVIPPQFQSAKSFSEGLAAVKLSPTRSLTLSPSGGVHSQSLLMSQEWGAPELDYRWGYIDRTGTVAIPAQFDSAESFAEGLAAVEIGGKWGYINTHGKVVILPRFTKVENFAEGVAKVYQDYRKWRYIDKLGQPVSSYIFDAKHLPEFSEGLSVVSIEGRYGYIDPIGQLIIPPQFDRAQPFCDGVAAVAVRDQSGQLQWGYINITGSVVIPCQFYQAEAFSQGVAKVYYDDHRWRYLTVTGEPVSSYIFETNRVLRFSEGLAASSIEGEFDDIGYIDEVGRVIIPAQFEIARPFSEGLAAVAIANRWGYVNKMGMVAIPLQFEQAEEFVQGVAKVYTDAHHWRYIDRSGQPVSPYVFDDSTRLQFSGGLSAVQLDGKYGYIDTKGRMVIAPRFEAAGSFAEGLAAVQIGDRWGYINSLGQVVIQPQFNSADAFVRGRARVKLKTKGLGSLLMQEVSRYIDTTGKFVN